MVQRYAHLSIEHLAAYVDRIGGTNLAQSGNVNEGKGT
jgi:hypothetical protein